MPWSMQCMCDGGRPQPITSMRGWKRGIRPASVKGRRSAALAFAQPSGQRGRDKASIIATTSSSPPSERANTSRHGMPRRWAGSPNAPQRSRRLEGCDCNEFADERKKSSMKTISWKRAAAVICCLGSQGTDSAMGEGVPGFTGASLKRRRAAWNVARQLAPIGQPPQEYAPAAFRVRAGTCSLPRPLKAANRSHLRPPACER